MELLYKHLLPFLGGAVLPPLLLFNSHLIKSTVSSQGQPVPKITDSPTPTTLPSHTPTPSPSLIPTPKPTRTPTLILTPTPTTKPVTAEQLDSWFTKYSNQYNVKRQQLWLIAVCESNLRPQANNGDYGGLYQFSSSTWKSTRKQMNEDPDVNLRFNPEESIKSAAFLLSTLGKAPWPNCVKE